MIVGQEAAIGRHAATAIAARDGRGGPDGIGHAPAAEMFAGARRQVLPLRNPLDGLMPFNNDAAMSVDRQIDGKADTDRATTNDDHIIFTFCFGHHGLRSSGRRHLAQQSRLPAAEVPA